ncbi:MAG: hypothetical protein AB1599_07540 [Planctomycetota bacterium]
MIKISPARIIIAIALILLIAGTSNGYTKLKKRWEIDFEYQPLKTFTNIDPLGARKNYYYFTYSLANKSDETIPLNIDVTLKIDLTHPELLTSGYKPRVKYYQDSLLPLVEENIIFTEEKLLGLAVGVRKDRIKELKEKLFYLNCQEIRAKKDLFSNERITGIAIFEEVDPQARLYEVMVGGLVDVVKRRYPGEPQPDAVKDSHIEKDLQDARSGKTPTYEYENRIRVVTYLCEGDEFNKQAKPLMEQVIASKWIIRNYGPIGEKNMLETLIAALTDENPAIRWSSFYLLRRLTGQSFNYDPEKEVTDEDNQKSVKLWQEWWYRSKEKLIYNKVLNQFQVTEPAK